MTAAERFTIRNVSGQFVEAHTERQPSGEPVAVLKTHKRGSVDIEGTRRQIEALHDDAVFYADPWGPDECPDGLKASARRIVARLAAAGFDVPRK